MNRREALMSLAALPGFTRINAERLKPESVIVLEVNGRISNDIAERIKKNLENVFPGNKCVVIGDGAKLKVIDR